MPYQFPRCQILPLPDQQAAVLIDGSERLRWHFGKQYPRPFFYPLNGPRGSSLTRMGHPGAENHDHHRSAWFAHHKVLGISFWSDSTDARIEQLNWYVYEDRDDAAIMAMRLGWYDGHDPQPLLTQEVIARIAPAPVTWGGVAKGVGETLLDVHTKFVPTADSLEFQQTNFGFFAVRVAKNLSEHFGGGKLTDSHGRVGEKAIFGKTAAWMDYSGPVPPANVEERANAEPPWEGITYFDHPSNADHPTHWHVRSDGWMGASACFAKSRVTTKEQPLSLRYRLHVHNGPVDAERAKLVQADFAKQPALTVQPGTGVPHHQWIVKPAK